MATLYAALVTPLTGPLALYGQAAAQGLALWAKSAAKLPSPWTEVQLSVRDTGKNTSAAIHEAEALRPDVLFGPYGSHTMLSAARASSRVIWNHGGATSELARPAFAHVINVLSPASMYFAAVLQAIHATDPEATTVALLHSTTGFGQDVATGAKAETQALGMTIQAVLYAPSEVITAASQVKQAHVLLVVGNFADERAVAPILLAHPFRFAAFVGAGVEEVLTPLQELREGVLGPAQWIATVAPQPDEGPDASWFVTQYRATYGTDPSYPAAQAFAAGVLCARCLRDSGSADDAAQLDAARKLCVRLPQIEATPSCYPQDIHSQRQFSTDLSPKYPRKWWKKGLSEPLKSGIFVLITEQFPTTGTTQDDPHARFSGFGGPMPHPCRDAGF